MRPPEAVIEKHHDFQPGSDPHAAEKALNEWDSRSRDREHDRRRDEERRRSERYSSMYVSRSGLNCSNH